MLWIVLIIIVVAIGLSVYSRKNSKSNFCKEQLDLIKDLVYEKIVEIKNEKQNIIDKASAEGKTAPLSVFIENLEKTKEEHPDDLEYADEIDRQIKELKDKYGDEIPVADLYKMLTGYEDEYGPV